MWLYTATLCLAVCFNAEFLVAADPVSNDSDLLLLSSPSVRVGIDRTKGGAITFLAWPGNEKNAVNVHDPGRLIQQSYYAGRILDRRSEGQSAQWSPWPWNPIQGGGVSSWARVTEFRRDDNLSLFVETVPKLWDMPSEEAAARMRQWIRFEPELTGVIQVECEFEAMRDENDRWGPAVPRAQEIPACYFTRQFDRMRSYLGDGDWRDETQSPGPPWGRCDPPRRAMAFFASEGQGIGVFSPESQGLWNFGPHGESPSDDSEAGPCMHVAPLITLNLGPRSKFRYRYWIVVGSESDVAERLDVLWRKYADVSAVTR